jgi:hypothetical protein
LYYVFAVGEFEAILGFAPVTEIEPPGGGLVTEEVSGVSSAYYKNS